LAKPHVLFLDDRRIWPSIPHKVDHELRTWEGAKEGGREGAKEGRREGGGEKGKEGEGIEGGVWSSAIQTSVIKEIECSRR